MAEKKAKLVYTPIPPKSRAGAASVYTEAIEEFLASGEPSAEVTELATKSASIVLGLTKAMMTLGVSEKLKVTRRGNAVYLMRVGK